MVGSLKLWALTRVYARDRDCSRRRAHARARAGGYYSSRVLRIDAAKRSVRCVDNRGKVLTVKISLIFSM